MDALGEFLETSTIHGLAHINRSKSLVAKILWILAVLFGFLTSGFLIHRSYVKWGNSPIASTISTHPIADLGFPKVIVCPPRGSNTALNHDLVKVGEGSPSEEKKQEMAKAVEKIFVEDPHEEYAMQRTALINKENLRDLYIGLQPLPKDVKYIIPHKRAKDMVELRSTALKGRFSSPRIKKLSNPSWERSERHTRYVLDFPGNIKELIGSHGTLVIEISVNINDSEEFITVNRGGESKFVKLQRSNSWQDAEDQCLEKGGHLASILAPEEKRQLDDNPDYDIRQYILGGKRVNGEWTWSDGNIFINDNTSFYIDKTYDGDCLWYNDPFVEQHDCNEGAIPLCKIGHTNLTGQTNITFVIAQNDFHIKMPKIFLEHHREETLLERKDSGFTIDWFIDNGSLSFEASSNNLNGNIKSQNLNSKLRLNMGQKLRYHFSIENPHPTMDSKLTTVVISQNETHNNKLWSPTVKYNIFRKKYLKFGKEDKTWRSAYSSCLKMGGNLPSVHSNKELDELGKEVGDYSEGFWLGGRLLRSSGTWAWSDGSPWDFANWDSDDPKWGNQGGENNCSVIWDDLTWWDWPCPNTKTQRFACQYQAPLHNKNILIQSNSSTGYVTFKAEDRSVATIHFWLDYILTDDSKREQSMPIFEIWWYTNDIGESSNGFDTGLITSKNQSWIPSKGTAEHKDLFVVRIVNVIPEARKVNISAKELLKRATQFKKKMLTELHLIDWCVSFHTTEIKRDYKMDIFDGFLHHMKLHSHSQIDRCLLCQYT